MSKDKLVEAVCNSYKVEKVNGQNTWETVRAHRSLLEKSENYPVLDGLETAWQTLDGFYNLGGEVKIINRKKDEETAQSPIDAFLYYIDSGFYPPPEIMLAIYGCFSIYKECGGEVELEDVFYGPRPKGKGNFAKRQSQANLYQHFSFHISLQRIKEKNKKLPRKPLSEIAEEFWQGEMFHPLGDNVPDVDSFLRGYRRWKETP